MASFQRLSYVFLISSLLVLLAASSSTALSNRGHEHARVAQHLANSRKRMEKRQFGQFGNGGFGQAAGATTTTEPVGGAVATTTTTTPAAAAGAQQTTPTPTSTTNNNGGILGPILGTSSSISSSVSAQAVSSTTSSVSSAPSLTSSSVSSSSSFISTPTIAINTDTQTSSRPILSMSTARGTVSVTSTVGVLPTSSAAASTSNANTFGKNTIIAIAVIAGGIGGAAAIWTLIRKWKLGPSAKFDHRMQPIEWSPDGESGLPGAGREKPAGTMSEKARPSSTGSAGSFHSGGADHGRNVTGNGNMFADQEPVHDFTAGAAQPPNAYEYNAGYVDLHRNNSGASTGAVDLTRAGSQGTHAPAAYSHGYEYNAHSRGYGGSGYEETDAAYAQDAYGGYETYAQHQYPAEQYGNYSHDAHAAGYNQPAYPNGRY